VRHPVPNPAIPCCRKSNPVTWSDATSVCFIPRSGGCRCGDRRGRGRRWRGRDLSLRDGRGGHGGQADEQSRDTPACGERLHTAGDRSPRRHVGHDALSPSVSSGLRQRSSPVGFPGVGFPGGSARHSGRPRQATSMNSPHRPAGLHGPCEGVARNVSGTRRGRRGPSVCIRPRRPSRKVSSTPLRATSTSPYVATVTSRTAANRSSPAAYSHSFNPIIDQPILDAGPGPPTCRAGSPTGSRADVFLVRFPRVPFPRAEPCGIRAVAPQARRRSATSLSNKLLRCRSESSALAAERR